MSHLRRLWPGGLAGRLIALLVAALALAQLALILILHSQQDFVIDSIVHGQALNQMVALTRLVAGRPDEEAQKLVAAFGSRESCAVTGTGPLPGRTMNGGEDDLADVLQHMLQGVAVTATSVAIEPIDRHDQLCGAGRAAGTEDGEAPPAGRPTGRIAALALSAALKDGHIVTLRMAVDVPSGWSRVGLLSLVLSSLAAAAVVILAVRSQTHILRRLADASDRLGRGETVPPLAAGGPSEVAAAVNAFNTMQQRLGASMRDRLRLLASISHDLRTPLTTLRLKAEFIEDEEARADIVATIDELSVICQATLAFTHAEAATEATARIDLADLVDEVVDDFLLAGQAIDRPVPQPAPIPCDCRPVALKRALRNLVENAIRYGGGARVFVEQEGASAVIGVEDDGPGIPDDRIGDAFEPFVRLEPSRNAATGGIGLGLAIARSIVKAHGGTLTLANRPQGGLRAELHVPLRQSNHSAAPAIDARRGAPASTWPGEPVQAGRAVPDDSSFGGQSGSA